MNPRRQMIEDMVKGSQDATKTPGFQFFKKLQQKCNKYNVPFHAVNPSNFQVFSGDEETLEFLAESFATLMFNLWVPACREFGPEMAEKMIGGVTLRWE